MKTYIVKVHSQGTDRWFKKTGLVYSEYIPAILWTNADKDWRVNGQVTESTTDSGITANGSKALRQSNMPMMKKLGILMASIIMRIVKHLKS